jgi:tRNA modification GTPase
MTHLSKTLSSSGNLQVNDTIAAIATAPGHAGIAVIKISGPGAIKILHTVFKGKKEPSLFPRRMIHGHITDGSVTLDEVLVNFMKAPHSYTGEDVVEIQSHGGYTAAGTILGLVLDKGARTAEPGEFTKRAFLNGRIDLAQAEAVMEIVSAEGKEHLKHAEKLMEGAFSQRINILIDELALSESLIELNIDFLDQGLEAIPKDKLKRSIESTLRTIDAMLTSYRTAQRIKNGLRVVLAGKVNSGKSSLFNTLLGRKRSIVHQRPGTTRDWIEEKIELSGLPVNLIDTAGLRETEDEIEREGVNESKRFLKNAEIVIFLHEAGKEDLTHEKLLSEKNVIHVVSKSDLLDNTNKNNNLVYISSLTGEGIDSLRDAIIAKASLLIDSGDSDSMVIVERHRILLSKARDHLIEALKSIDVWSEEITALELKAAQNELEEIIGINSSIDVLETVFKNFCIGK